jgi:hypothetical protein
MAVLFDAMMFLTVMTLVSVSMLSLLGSDQDEDVAQRYVESVHSTILASTISFQEGPPCTVADLVGSFLRTGKELSGEMIEEAVLPLLAGYFGPGIQFQWFMENGESRYSFGSRSFQDGGGGDVHVSQVRWQDDGKAIVCGLRVRYL